MSFMSMEPQSREALESQSKGLLAHFDSHLKIIVDRYLTFFQKRRSIEADYISSLRKLHHEANVVDGSFDPRAEPTTRFAWDKIRDCLEGEAGTREIFMNSLEIDVIKPLLTLKENGELTKRRVEKELKNSAADYADYAEKLAKYHPGEHPHSAGPQPASNKKFGVMGLFQARNRRDLDRSESEEILLEDDCRKVVRCLNVIRSNRAENLEDGYNCLEDLVFKTTIKGVLVKYLDDTITASKAYYDLAMDTRPGVGKALIRGDDTDLMGSFRRAFSLSVPPVTLYRNYRPGGYSNLTFGVPLVDPTSNQYDVPKVIRMCITEVEYRGLDASKIYSTGSINDAEVLQLRRRFENERTFSFSSSDDIHSVATLLKLYLWDLPEPLLRLSLRDFRQYGQNKARYTENDFSLLRSVIRKLHPVHRETLRALSRHLSLVASHSTQNGMNAKTLASQFCYAVFRGNTIVQGYVLLKDSLMADLIQNAHTLFDKPLTPSSLPSAQAGRRNSLISYNSFFGSSLFAEPRVIGPEDSSARSSSSVFPSDYSTNFSTPPRLPPGLFLSPLLGLTPSQTLTDTERTDSPEPEPSISEAKGPNAVTSPRTSPPPPFTSAPERPLPQPPHPYLQPPQPYLQPPQPYLQPYLQSPNVRRSPPNSPPISLPPSTAFHPASSATSLQSGARTFTL